MAISGLFRPDSRFALVPLELASRTQLILKQSYCKYMALIEKNTCRTKTGCQDEPYSACPGPSLHASFSISFSDLMRRMRVELCALCPPTRASNSGVDFVDEKPGASRVLVLKPWARELDLTNCNLEEHMAVNSERLCMQCSQGSYVQG